MTIIGVVIAFVVSAAATRWFAVYHRSDRWLDMPNARSLHTVPVPRTGGLAMSLGVVIGLWFCAPDSVDTLWPVALAAGLLGAVSFIDDVRGMPVLARLLVHVMTASVVVLSMDSLLVLFQSADPFIAGALRIAAIVFLVWMINMYNFMDGIDGFAAGMAVIGFGTFALLGWTAQAELFTIMCLLIMAVAGGFLIFNFPPATIFMGDTGSSLLGFLAGVFILWGTGLDVFSLVVGVIVFSPFLMDATMTLLRRLFAGETLWRAHRSHFYQRLVQLGWGHRKTVLLEYVLMLTVAVTALTIVRKPITTQINGVIVLTVLYCAGAVIISIAERRRRQRVPQRKSA